MPPTQPQTVHDLIVLRDAEYATNAEAVTAAAAADQALADSNSAVDAVDATLGSALDKIGEVSSTGADGSVVVYGPDGHGGYHASHPKPDTTPLPDLPTPTPDPTPTPTPTDPAVPLDPNEVPPSPPTPVAPPDFGGTGDPGTVG